LWIKYDNITPKQADQLLKRAITSKTEMAPEGRATFAKGAAKDLPKRIREALEIAPENLSDVQKKIK
jgi:hypothetical protein